MRERGNREKVERKGRIEDDGGLDTRMGVRESKRDGGREGGRKRGREGERREGIGRREKRVMSSEE